MDHTFKEGLYNSTLGKLFKKDIRMCPIIFSLGILFWLKELYFIHTIFICYCYIKDFKIMMTQLR